MHSCDPLSLQSEARSNSEPQTGSEAENEKAIKSET